MYSTCPQTQRWLYKTLQYWAKSPCRAVSTTSAINRGLRATQDSNRPERRVYRGDQSTSAKKRSFENRSAAGGGGDAFDRASSRYASARQRPPPSRTGPASRQPSRGSDRRPEYEKRRPTRSIEARGGESASTPENDSIPVPVQYTTAASVFLYGAHTVYSALKAGRRRAYHLHLYKQLNGPDTQSNEIQRIARQNNIPITRHQSAYILNRMSEDRPHNGIVLEASRLPAPPVATLGSFNAQDGTIQIDLEHQTAEDEAINGTSTLLQSSMKYAGGRATRQPFVVMLDGITDPQNVGSILRTCYFYGVDAVAIAVNTCAPLTSSALAKASSGACEAIPILAVKRPSAFVVNSAKAGWRLFAAVAPDTSSHQTGLKASAKQNRQHTTESLAISKPLTNSPCILMLGSEDKGLSRTLRDKAADSVSIESGRAANERLKMGIDSMNVSVAAGALLESFLRPRGNPTKTKEADGLGF